MKKRNNDCIENISNRRNKWNIIYNDYTGRASMADFLAVCQSGHKKYTPPNFKCGPDIYDHYIIHFITEGKGTYTNGTCTYHLQKGDLFLILPYQCISYQADAVTPWKYYWVGFNGTEVYKILNLCGFSKESPVLHYDRNDLLLQYMNAIAYLNYRGAAQEYGLLGYLYQIFSCLASVNQMKINNTYTDYFYKAVQYIRLNYNSSDLTVTKIADYVGINRSHLYRIFDEISNQSVQSYIKEIRLNKAVTLLENSDYKIGEIAQNCGFSDQSHFSGIFKKKFHVTPLQYRKQFLKKMK